jgi:hypothetical protein
MLSAVSSPSLTHVPGLAFRTAADDSRCICLAILTPVAAIIPVYIPFTYVYTRLHPAASEDAKLAIFADFSVGLWTPGDMRVQPAGGEGVRRMELIFL